MSIQINSRRARQAGYAPVLALAMAMMFGRLLLFAKVLDVPAFAELNAILIVSGLAGMLAGFGLFLDMQRKLPGQLALRQRRLAATHIGQSIIGASAVGLFGLLLAAMHVTSGGITPSIIAFGAIHGALQQIFLIVTTESRSNNELLRFSIQSLTRSVGLVLVSIPAAYIFQTAQAAILAESAVTAALIILIWRGVSRRLSISYRTAARLAWRSLKSLNPGPIVTLLLLSIATACSLNLDRWLSSTYLRPADFAQYSFAWITLTAAFAVQGLVNASVFPMIARRSTTHGLRPAFRVSAMVTFGMLSVFLVAIVPAVYLADIAIDRFYPKYVAATPLIPILAIAAAFRLSDFWSSFLVINGQERVCLAINICVNIVALAVWMSTRFGANSTALSLAYLAAFSAVGTFTLSLIYSYRTANA